jgi:hypothetical protein
MPDEVDSLVFGRCHFGLLAWLTVGGNKSYKKIFFLRNM